MSDKQKGLIPAFETVFPTSDNRFCVRHLHGNMKRAGFKGLAHKKALWKAARATTMGEFNARMKEFAKLDVKACEWLSDKPPSQWSRSHFNTHPKCDILLNNLCESFNANILEAREKHIYTMLEAIREFLMIRMQQNRDKATKRWKGKVCPRIKKILMKNGDKTSDCIPIKSTDVHYEINCFDGSRCIVDLEKHTCSSRKWDISGIPCKHAISAINCQMLDPLDFVHPCYSVETYLRVYQHCIYPVNGPEKWKQTGGVPFLPPNLGRGVGRPARARRMEPDEVRNKQKKNAFYGKSKQLRMRRQQATLHCKYCGEEGHNKKGCKRRKEIEGCNTTTENANMEERENTQMPDWGEETDWDQISLEVSNFLETGNFSSQASLQQTAVTTTSSQGGPSNQTEFARIEKLHVVTAKSSQSGPSKKRKSIAIQKQPARRSTRLQSAKPNSDELIAQPAKNIARSNLGFNPPRRMPPTPTANLPNPASIPPARGGVTIRPPVPFAIGHPRVAISISTQKMTPLQHQFKVIDKDGQKYVTMKSLEDALNARREAAKKARIECDGKGKQV